MQDLLAQRELAKSNKLAGIVVAATGNGTISKALERALQAAEAAGVVVWRSSRCAFGALVGKEASRFGRVELLTSDADIAEIAGAAADRAGAASGIKLLQAVDGHDFLLQKGLVLQRALPILKPVTSVWRVTCNKIRPLQVCVAQTANWTWIAIGNWQPAKG